jgi:hypothetical protein
MNLKKEEENCESKKIDFDDFTAFEIEMRK